MLEKPDLDELRLASCCHKSYGLDIRQVTFLPWGYDLNTAVYRLDGFDGQAYFLKLRKGDFSTITVLLPHFLHRIGLTTIIAPLETRTHQLFCQLDNYTLVLYPFISGQDGYQVQLTGDQWVQLGQTLHAVHSAQLPPSLARQIPGEHFDPQWRESASYFLHQLSTPIDYDPIARQFSDFMFSKRQLIGHMLKRAEVLAAELQNQPIEYVLCHSDAHPGNYLISKTGALYLVDWDNPVYAPKEHDLMCFGSGMSGMQPGGREERLFYQGYGPSEIDHRALAYYRYERIIQDIAEFCRQVLGSTARDEDRAQSYLYFTRSFMPGAEVEVALRTDPLATGVS
jgi:spectinomycin phosphotransferase